MINYLVGDATEPVGGGLKFVVHICNDIGAWGAGFVTAISRKWLKPEIEYKNLYYDGKVKLGVIQEVEVAPDITVINMIAQKGIRSSLTSAPIRYDSLEECLYKVFLLAKERAATVHMPRIGCGLAGGNWETVEEIITRTMKDLEVYVYDLPKR